ncbi:hypothetical protein SDC9_180601 [bioreactor metagenome]|uniref:Uncharacterized protein n=1 Tax=bioreactor metagenome TaxID=1076179 RepID=A0A645H281_9ZZZZ
MEVSAGNDRLVIQKQQRVVGDGIQLDLNLAPHILQRIADSAVELGNAAQGVGILHTVLLTVVQNLGTCQEPAHVGCHQHLTLLAADGVNAGIKRVAKAGERFEVQGTDGVGQLSGADGII